MKILAILLATVLLVFSGEWLFSQENNIEVNTSTTAGETETIYTPGNLGVGDSLFQDTDAAAKLHIIRNSSLAGIRLSQTGTAEGISSWDFENTYDKLSLNYTNQSISGTRNRFTFGREGQLGFGTELKFNDYGSAHNFAVLYTPGEGLLFQNFDPNIGGLPAPAYHMGMEGFGIGTDEAHAHLHIMREVPVIRLDGQYDDGSSVGDGGTPGEKGTIDAVWDIRNETGSLNFDYNTSELFSMNKEGTLTAQRLIAGSFDSDDFQNFQEGLWTENGAGIQYGEGDIIIQDGILTAERLVAGNFNSDDFQNFQEGLWTENEEGNINYYSGDVGIGIGTNNPDARLHVAINESMIDTAGVSDIALFYHWNGGGNDKTRPRLYLRGKSKSDYSSAGQIIFETTYGIGGADLLFQTHHQKNALLIEEHGNVGIGVGDAQAKLHVDGKIQASEVLITLDTWQDIVFSPDYELMPLSTVDAFIQKHRHLPGIPSEKEIVKSGMATGEMVSLQMKKIEELTLYTIEQEKNIATQQQQIDMLMKEVNELKKQINTKDNE